MKNLNEDLNAVDLRRYGTQHIESDQLLSKNTESNLSVRYRHTTVARLHFLPLSQHSYDQHQNNPSISIAA